jgi:anaerobic selenocysteine-containing dehydrogenase
MASFETATKDSGRVTREERPVTRQGICGICPAGCWVEVGLRNGKIESIQPDENHALGMICRRGQHAPQIIYSENRLRYPMMRTGPKGTHAFQRVSWDAAYERIVAELNRIKEESGPQAAAIYTGRGAFELSLCDIFQPKGVAVSSASNVLFPFGSPNTMGVGSFGAPTRRQTRRRWTCTGSRPLPVAGPM